MQGNARISDVTSVTSVTSCCDRMWKACGRSGLTCLNLGCRLARGSDFIIVGHPEFQMGKVQAADAGRLWDLVQLMNHLDGEVSVFSYFMFSFC